MKSKRKRDRRGFTLIELSVVLVLLSLVTLMVVSFSEMIGKFVQQDSGSFTFYEECAELKQTLFDVLQSEDETNGVCTVASNTLQGNGYTVTVSADAVVISRSGNSEELTFHEIDAVVFETQSGGRAVKCTAYRHSEEEEEGNAQSFLITMRCGTFQTAGE